MLGLHNLTPAVRTLLILIAVCTGLNLVGELAFNFPLALHPMLLPDSLHKGHVWVLATYPFVYVRSALLYWLWSSLGLWSLGSALESEIGTRRFYRLFALTTMIGGLTNYAVQMAGLGFSPYSAMGVFVPEFAIVLAFCRLNRNSDVMFNFLSMTTGTMAVVFTLFCCIVAPSCIPAFLTTSFAAYIYITGRWPSPRWMSKRASRPSRLSFTSGRDNLGPKVVPLRADRTTKPQDSLEAEVDRILDKLRVEGMSALTPEEKATLDRQSTRLSREGSH